MGLDLSQCKGFELSAIESNWERLDLNGIELELTRLSRIDLALLGLKSNDFQHNYSL